MPDVPVAMHEDEVTDDARERLAKSERPIEYGGDYYDCPGCALLVYREHLHDHANRCGALRALVTYEADAHPRAA